MKSPEEIARKVLYDVEWHGKLPIKPEQVAKCYNIDVIHDDTLAHGPTSGKYFPIPDGGGVILINPTDSRTRQRLAIAHHLGHALLHKHRWKKGGNARYTIDKYREEELQANKFAAELLMPLLLVFELVKEDKNIEEMADVFDVSLTTMRVRLESLGLI